MNYFHYTVTETYQMLLFAICYSNRNWVININKNQGSVVDEWILIVIDDSTIYERNHKCLIRYRVGPLMVKICFRTCAKDWRGNSTADI